jgi:hypothetical protein
MPLSSKEIARREKSRVTKDRARELKKLGIIQFSLRGTLTPQQKSAVTRQYHKFADLVNRPFEFGTKTLDKKRASKITTTSFVTGRGQKRKVWIYKKPNEKIVWSRDGYKLVGSGYTERVPDSMPAWDEKKVRKLFASLKEGEFVMLRQWDKTPIRRTFYDLESLLDWAEHYRDEDSSNEKWLAELSVFSVDGEIPEHMLSRRKHTRRRSEQEKASRKAWKKTPAGRAQKKAGERRRLARKAAK